MTDTPTTVVPGFEYYGSESPRSAEESEFLRQAREIDAPLSALLSGKRRDAVIVILGAALGASVADLPESSAEEFLELAHDIAVDAADLRRVARAKQASEPRH